uniref:Uncharacterized protein n=1 Tax=Rhizophora mucronata TaxID=61149 RepID=A0A2P2IV52_RHIMU
MLKSRKITCLGINMAVCQRKLTFQAILLIWGSQLKRKDCQKLLLMDNLRLHCPKIYLLR